MLSHIPLQVETGKLENPGTVHVCFPRDDPYCSVWILVSFYSSYFSNVCRNLNSFKMLWFWIRSFFLWQRINFAGFVFFPVCERCEIRSRRFHLCQGTAHHCTVNPEYICLQCLPNTFLSSNVSLCCDNSFGFID